MPVSLEEVPGTAFNRNILHVWKLPAPTAKGATVYVRAMQATLVEAHSAQLGATTLRVQQLRVITVWRSERRTRLILRDVLAFLGSKVAANSKVVGSHRAMRLIRGPVMTQVLV